MSKKSNKTEHVLKLITKNQEAEDTKEKASPAAKKARTKKDNATDELKEQLKEELKEELREELKEELRPQVIEELNEEAQDEEIIEEPIEEIIDITIDGIEDDEPEPEPVPLMTKSYNLKQVEAAGDKPIGTHKAPLPISRASGNLKIMNLAENLAVEMMDEVIKKLNVCDCDICRADVLALTLNYIPQKYVTSDTGKQYMQIDIFKKQYETDMLAALTRACVRVKGSPRHN